MSPDWSCTVLVHNRTCCGKYRGKVVNMNSLISVSHCDPKVLCTQAKILKNLVN